MSSGLIYWLWLSTLTNIGLNSKAALLGHFGTAEAAFLAGDEELRTIEGISERDAHLLSQKSLAIAEAVPEKCEAAGIDIITFDDARYPETLKNIYAPPCVLYVRGRLPDIEKYCAVSVIGTRKATPYGIKMGRSMAYELSRCGAVIVSGLTAGIDAAAAEGVLLAGGKCIGVLGTPIPAVGNSLYKSVAASGALVSEYAPGTKQLRTFFRERNRIAAGLSEGVVVIEAPEKSGTRLFVAEALEQGKDIFALPGNADSESSAGTLKFLREGAKLVAHGWEVAEEFVSNYPGTLDVQRMESVPEYHPECAVAEKKPAKSCKQPKAADNRPGKPGKQVLPGLSEEEMLVIGAIGTAGASADEIINATGLLTGRVMSLLTFLEIKGVIRKEPGGRIVLKTEK